LYKRRVPTRRNLSIGKLIGFSPIGKSRSIDEPHAGATSLPAALARRRRLKRRLVTPITERRARRRTAYQGWKEATNGNWRSNLPWRLIRRRYTACLQPRPRSIIFLDHRSTALRAELLKFLSHAIRNSLHAQEVQAAKAKGVGCAGLTCSVFNVLRNSGMGIDQKRYGRADEHQRPPAGNTCPLHSPLPIRFCPDHFYHFGGKHRRIVPAVFRGTDVPLIPHSAMFSSSINR
jgi:hypothetical protein